jgi:tetratricopeptide (TPR) repeat protein
VTVGESRARFAWRAPFWDNSDGMRSPLQLRPILHEAGSEHPGRSSRPLSTPRHRLCFVRSIAALTLALHVAGNALAQSAGSPQQLLAKHQYAEALVASSRGLASHPTDAQLSLVRCLALAGLGRTTQSLASFDQTLRLTHNDIPVLEAASQVAYGAREPRAAKYLDLLLQKDPGNEVAHAMAGVLAFERHDCPTADAHFGRAPEVLRGNIAAEVQHGECLLATGEIIPAVALFERLATEHPQRWELQYDRAVAYVQAGRFAEAITILQALQAAGETMNGDTLNLLGAALNGNGELEAAIAAYRQAAQENPHDARNYIDLATVSMEHQSPAPALEILNAGIAQNPHSAALLALRGAVRAQMGENDAATEDFEAADQLQPSKLYGAVGLGVLFRDSSKLQQAERLVRTRLRSHPSDPTLNYLLADVLVREGAAPGDAGFNEAHRLLRKAVALDPTMAVAYGELGKLDLKTGHTQEAIAELEKGVHYDPTDRTSLNQLVAAYRRVGRTEDAARVAAQLGSAVEHDRAQETERNRVHLTTTAPQITVHPAARD